MYPASISPQAQLGQGYLKATEWESEREKIHKYIHNYINYIYIHTYRHPFIHTSDVYSGRFPVTSFAAPVPRNELWKLHSVLPRQWIGDVLLFRVDGERSKEAHSATPGIGLQCLQALQISLTLPFSVWRWEDALFPEASWRATRFVAGSTTRLPLWTLRLPSSWWGRQKGKIVAGAWSVTVMNWCAIASVNTSMHWPELPRYRGMSTVMTNNEEYIKGSKDLNVATIYKGVPITPAWSLKMGTTWHSTE